jgi:deazaflavin-dependent oxidoreductase (nitroreductase family)
MALAKPLQPLLRFMSTPRGTRVDVPIVRYTGRSLLGELLSRQMGRTPTRGGRAGAASGPMTLTTIGRRTGKLHTIAISYRRTPDGAIAIVGSAGGAPRDPHWVGNVRANPAAWVTIGRRRIPVRGEVLQGEDKEPLWGIITSAAPIFAQYQEKAGRDIPVVVLRRYDGQPVT